MIDKIMTEKISLVKGTSFMVRQVLQWAFEYEIHWSYNITCKHLALRIVNMLWVWIKHQLWTQHHAWWSTFLQGIVYTLIQCWYLIPHPQLLEFMS